jgi:uncharacterized delta-60 repeat protein
MQSDGKIIISGYIASFNGNSIFPNSAGSSYCDFRINPDGTFDNTFLSQSVVLKDIQIQPDNKILYTQGSYLRRLTADGFTDGYFNNQLCPHLISSPNGKKYLLYNDQTVTNGQYRLGRYNENGTPDTVFGTPSLNIAIIPSLFNDPLTLKILPDNKILVFGNSNGVEGSSSNSKKIIKINSDGKTLDTSFSSADLNIDDPDNLSIIRDVYNLPNGKYIVIIDKANGITDFTRKIKRLNSNGSIDITFNEGVFSPIPFNSGIPRRTIIAALSILL